MILNDLSLPYPVFDVLNQIGSAYDPGESDFTATSLSKPPYVRVLEQRHGKQDEGISDLSLSILGTAFHYAAENHADNDNIVEHRAYGTFNVDGRDYIVSSMIDLIHEPTGHMIDWKVVGGYSADKIAEGSNADYIYQLQLGRYLVEKELGIKIHRISNAVVLRDWSRHRSKQYPIFVQDYPIWGDDSVVLQTEIKIRKQISGAYCTPEERWRREDTYRVVKRGTTRSVKNFTDRDAAERHAAGMKGDYFVDVKPGHDEYCENYCPMRSVCNIKVSNHN